MSDKINLSNINPHQEQKEEKDFYFPLSLDDFKIEENKKKYVGSLGELTIITYLKNKKSYLLKITKKDEILSNKKNIKNYLDSIYKIQPNPYCIKLLYHFEDDDQFYFIFKNYEKIKTIPELFSEYEINDNNLCIIYHHILIGLSYIHKQKIYGSLLNIDSIIYDEIDKVIKLTDCGFSNLFPEKKENNPFVLNNGALFSEYTPPEFLLEKSFESKKKNEDYKKGEKYDMWQIGILFFKLASENKSPFEGNESSQINENILKCKVAYYKINDRSSKIFQIIGKLITKSSERYKLNKMLKLEPFIFPIKKFPQLDFIKKEKKSLFEVIKIYPKESFVPKLKKENLFSIQLEKQQAYDLCSDLNKLNDEYKKINKSKKALKNLLSYINKQITIYTNEDKEEANNLIKKFDQLNLGSETFTLYNEIFSKKKGISEERYQSLIKLLLYEIVNLKMNLENEKKQNSILKKTVEESLQSKNEIIKTYQDKISFLNSKIQILEETIFQESNNSNNLISNSVNNLKEHFLNLNKRFSNLSNNINNQISQKFDDFLKEKEHYLKDLIEAKELFRKEILYYIKNEEEINKKEIPKVNTTFLKQNPKYEIKELLNTINKLKEELKQSNSIIDNNTQTMKQMTQAIQDKEAIISQYQIKDNNKIEND